MLTEITTDFLFLAFVVGGYLLAKSKHAGAATTAGIAVMGVVIGAVAAFISAVAALWLGIAGSAGLLLGTWSSRRPKS